MYLRHTKIFPYAQGHMIKISFFQVHWLVSTAQQKLLPAIGYNVTYMFMISIYETIGPKLGEL